ncbi:MAG: hypothetical protein CM1200mP41_28740 [Gammaproteobacteria bacterium]|nr:MAG: hypothetical protein CM1200mP41_28740 [Gammaproteobacteria bacterium]
MNGLTILLRASDPFTRDASHELRSPLTVIRIASDLLLNEEGSKNQTKYFASNKTCRRGMEKLVEAFLLLARESNRGLPLEAIAVSDVLVAEVEKNRVMIGDKPVDLQMEWGGELKGWRRARY